jgi:26S proteasome regulatory subunit N7
MPDASGKTEIPSNEYMQIAALCFAAGQGKAGAKDALLAAIKKNSMAPFYSSVCEQLGWTVDTALLASMNSANASELEKLDARIAECEEQEGETEVREAKLAKSEFKVRIGEKEGAYAAIEDTYGKTVAMGLRLDLLLTKLRVGLFFDDLKLVRDTVERAKGLLETGGDWERRNRLKVYEAMYLMRIRDLKKAADLLLDAIATFTATELVPYNQFIMYTVVTALAALPRKDLKPKVIDAPEILQVIGEIPHIAGLINGLYSCQYRTLFQSLVDIIEVLKADRYLAQHARHYWREVRVLAYSQFLESYMSVSLSSMAQTFGTSPNFLDQDLSQFISMGRLSCSIDKVNGIVSSTRPDTKNAQYQATIKQGDLLLNRVQKLSRVTNI